MDDEKENLVGIDDVYSDDFQTQILVSDLSVLVETVDGCLESDEGIDPDFCRYRGRLRKRTTKHASGWRVRLRP